MRTLLLAVAILTTACVADVDAPHSPDAGIEVLPEDHPPIEGWSSELVDGLRRPSGPGRETASLIGRSCSTCHLTPGPIPKGD